MSYNIRNIREISNDPLTKFTNDLAKKLSVFLNKQETDKLEGKEDIYSDGQDVDVVLRFQSDLSSTKYFDFQNEYYPPTEPDLDKVKLWIKGDNLGNEINDISGFSNHGTLYGDPVLVDGAPFDYGIHTGGTKSIALRLNRPTSDLENEEYIGITDASNLQITGIATGISLFIRFKIHSIATQGGLSRTIIEKVDDSTPNNGYMVKISSSGELQIIFKRSGTEYKWKTATSTITTNTVYEVFVTYAVSGNAVKCYINNVDKTLSDDSASSSSWHTTLTNHNLSIFRRGQGSTGGYTYGDLYDFMIYREKVVSATEVGHHYTNKWTIADIPFGQVMISNYWATYDLPDVPAYTSTSFTSTSYTQ